MRWRTGAIAAAPAAHGSRQAARSSSTVSGGAYGVGRAPYPATGGSTKPPTTSFVVSTTVPPAARAWSQSAKAVKSATEIAYVLHRVDRWWKTTAPSRRRAAPHR